MKDTMSAGKDRFARYRISVAWLIHDLSGMLRPLSIKIVILIAASLVLRLGAFVVLGKYIHMLESKATQHIPLIGSVIPSQSFELLIAASLACLLLFVLGAGTKYLAEVNLLELSTDYERICIKRAANGIGRYGGDPELEPWRSYFAKLITSDARYCGLIARMSIRLLMPASIAVATFLGLLYLDASLTGILLVLILICLPILYRINLKGARYSIAMERKNVAATQDKRAAVEDLARRLREAGDDTDARKVEADTHTPRVQEAMQAFIHRLRATEESNFLTSMLMGVAFFSILLYKGLQILETHQGWAFIAIYFLVLRICLGAVMQSANILTGINRLYPQFGRYRRFVQTVDRIARERGPAPPGGLLWRAQKQAPGVRPDLDDDELG